MHYFSGKGCFEFLESMHYCIGILTPCVGVWIEIAQPLSNPLPDKVTPCVGVWIEMSDVNPNCFCKVVTPCVGVWIEILISAKTEQQKMSLPAWECGLKSLKH